MGIIFEIKCGIFIFEIGSTLEMRAIYFGGNFSGTNSCYNMLNRLHVSTNCQEGFSLCILNMFENSSFMFLDWVHEDKMEINVPSWQ